jgi:branched-chain amino acid transport system substrate-binding protein
MTVINRRQACSGLLAGVALGFGRASANEAQPVRIGAMSDLSSAYSDVTGPALIEAVRMAIADFGPVLGQPAELLYADFQLKPDIAVSIARQWWDRDGVDAIIDLPSSSAALAILPISADKRKIVLATSTGSSEVTGKACSPYTTHWAYDSYAMAATLTRAVMSEGAKTWCFVAADYAFGASLVNDATNIIKTSGGDVVGVFRAPLNTMDFSSYLLQARSCGADVIAFANGGADTVNAVKQAAEFGLNKGRQKIAALVMMDTDVHSIGLETAHGIYIATAFYWDRNDASRSWSKLFYEKIGRPPTMLQAAAYSQTTHYLKAVSAAGAKDADKVMEKMRELPIHDFFAENGQVRIDGRMVHNMYLAQVKTPDESRSGWDQYKILSTIGPDRAFRPLSAGGCPLVK